MTIDDARLDRHRAELSDVARPVRLAYAATHLVMRSDYRSVADRYASDVDLAQYVDWDATLGIRRRLDSLGFAVAEAMDTAQRFQIGWPVARRLIEECGALHLQNGFVAGAGADHVGVTSKTELIDAVVEQARLIQRAGGEVILLPMPWLAAHAQGQADYVEVYGEIIRQLVGPLYVHWLGEAFAPALRGYFPGRSFERVMSLDPTVVRGAKLSLLDAAKECRLRRALVERDQILLTGDDFNFAPLIAGGDHDKHVTQPVEIERWTRIGTRDVALGDFSHALLGIFDAIAEPASLALRYLARGNVGAYFGLMLPAAQLSRSIFEAPTQHYKAGLAFLSWLNGDQENAILVDREETKRDRSHYLRVAALAAEAGVLRDAELAVDRLRRLGEVFLA